MADSENQLELKKRARRRLVGSAALALTAAIVLPMVMDHEPKPLTQDVQIRIPNQESAPPLRAPGARSSAPQAASVEQPKPDPAAKPETRPEPAPPVEPKPEAKPESKPLAKPELKPEPKPEVKPKPEPKPETKPESKPAAKPDNRAERAAQVEAILAGEAEEAPAGKAQDKGQFVVQLGAFGDQANVAKVRERVKAQGFSSYTELLKGAHGTQTRVRAGPFATREAADKAAAKLKHAGLAGVVAPK